MLITYLLTFVCLRSPAIPSKLCDIPAKSIYTRLSEYVIDLTIHRHHHHTDVLRGLNNRLLLGNINSKYFKCQSINQSIIKILST